MSAVFSIRNGETITYKAYMEDAPLWSKETASFIRAVKDGPDAVRRDIKWKESLERGKSDEVTRLSYRKPTMTEFKKLGLITRPGGNFAKPDGDHYTIVNYTDYGYEYNENRGEISIYINGRNSLRITKKNINNYLKIFSMGPGLYRAITFDRNTMKFKNPPDGIDAVVREYQQLSALPEDKINKALTGIAETKLKNIDWYIRPDETDDTLWPVTKIITVRSRITNEKLKFYFRGPEMYIGMPFGRVRIGEFTSVKSMYTYLASLCRTRHNTLTALSKALYEYKRLDELRGNQSVLEEFKETVTDIYNKDPWTWAKSLTLDTFIKKSEEYIYKKYNI